MPVSIDTEASDLCFERLPWDSELCGRTGRPGDAAVALGESSFDHLQFTISEHRKSSLRSRGFHGRGFEPVLVDEEGIRLNEDDRPFHDVL